MIISCHYYVSDRKLSNTDKIYPLPIPNQISTILMHIPSLVKTHWYLLKLPPGKENQWTNGWMYVRQIDRWTYNTWTTNVNMWILVKYKKKPTNTFWLKQKTVRAMFFVHSDILLSAEIRCISKVNYLKLRKMYIPEGFCCHPFYKRRELLRTFNKKIPPHYFETFKNGRRILSFKSSYNASAPPPPPPPISNIQQKDTSPLFWNF